jgi:hypothetical protein
MVARAEPPGAAKSACATSTIVGLAPRWSGRDQDPIGGRAESASTGIDRVAGLAVYLVEHGAVIKDGSTFGGVDEPWRFRVRYANSTRFPGLPVFFCGEPLAS